MRKNLLVGLLMLVAALPATGADAKEIIEAAIKAHGGKEALAKHPGHQYEFEGVMRERGQDMSVKGKAIEADGGRFRLDMTVAAGSQTLNIAQIVNGEKGSIKVIIGGKALPSEQMPADELKMSQIQSEITKLYPILDAKRFSLKAGPNAVVEGKKVNVVVVTVKDLSKDVTLSFDQTSGKLVKKARKLTKMGKEIDQEMFYHDYKGIDGVQVPMKEIVYEGGEKYITTNTTRYTFLNKVDDSLFRLDK